MAVTNTIGSFYRPEANLAQDFTPPKSEYLQTEGAATTQGTVKIFAAATASDDFRLLFANVVVTAPTASAEIVVYVGGTTAAYRFPTFSAAVPQSINLSFAPYGVICGTTTTATVSTEGTVGTATVTFLAGGLRNL